jgi:5'-phosphate synthase pdxT subunit
LTHAVGVLALQGDFAPHGAALARLGVDAREVRAPRDLASLSHLVLPGGESTTLWHLLELFGLVEPLVARHRAGELALFGTCAGAILLGRDGGERPPRLGLLDCAVARNAYGTQLDSFTRRLSIPVLGRELDCVFIRAPKLRTVGPGVEVLARDGDDPILVRAPALLAATFHPELTNDPGVHELFLTMDPATARLQNPSARAG